MHEHANKCPQCGRFTMDADRENTGPAPGFGDSAYHNPEGCDEYEGDVMGLAIFCTEACADRFHGRKAR